MKKHFVAHFDMLGMSSLLRRNPELAWQKISTLSKAKEEILSIGIERIDTGEHINAQVSTFTFSDTIIVFSKGDTENDALAIFLLSTELFTKALQNCIPLRGGIAHGLFAFNCEHNLFAGPALLDAYELGESSQWLGISMDGVVANALARLPVAMSSRGMPMLIEWKVPCKGVSDERVVVNWPESHRNNYVGPVPLPVETFYQQFSLLFGPFDKLNMATKAKYENTVDFFNSHLCA